MVNSGKDAGLLQYAHPNIVIKSTGLSKDSEILETVSTELKANYTVAQKNVYEVVSADGRKQTHFVAEEIPQKKKTGFSSQTRGWLATKHKELTAKFGAEAKKLIEDHIIVSAQAGENLYGNTRNYSRITIGYPQATERSELLLLQKELWSDEKRNFVAATKKECDRCGNHFMSAGKSTCTVCLGI
jgi:hypothetical protein